MTTRFLQGPLIRGSARLSAGRGNRAELQRRGRSRY